MLTFLGGGSYLNRVTPPTKSTSVSLTPPQGGSYGFSLVEAMVAAIIVAIGFAGVFTMTGVSTTSMKRAMDRQQIWVQANQMLDVIETDISNIDSYSMDFSTCNPPASDETERHQIKRYEWCRRLNDAVGQPRSGEVRSISVTDLPDARKRVSIRIDAQGGEVSVLLRRSYDG